MSSIMSFSCQSFTHPSTSNTFILLSFVLHTTLFTPALIIIFLHMKHGEMSIRELSPPYILLPKIYMSDPSMLAPDFDAFIMAFCSACTLLHNSYLWPEGMLSSLLRQFPRSQQSFVCLGAPT